MGGGDLRVQTAEQEQESSFWLWKAWFPSWYLGKESRGMARAWEGWQAGQGGLWHLGPDPFPKEGQAGGCVIQLRVTLMKHRRQVGFEKYGFGEYVYSSP